MLVFRLQHAPAPEPAPDPLHDAFVTLGLDPSADAALVDLSVRHHLNTCARVPLHASPQRAQIETIAAAHRRIRAARITAPPDPPAARTPYQTLCVHPTADQELIALVYRHLLARAAAAGDEAMLRVLECAYAQIGTPEARALYDREHAGLRLAPVEEGGVWRRISRAIARIRPASVPVRSEGGQGLVSAPRDAAAQVAEPETPDMPAAAEREVAHPVGALRVLEEGREIMTLPLRDHASYTIGAGPGATIRLPAAEREHARLTVGQGWILFQQIAEQTISLVNGARSVRALLGPGDWLDIGPYRCQYVIMRYEPRGWGG